MSARGIWRRLALTALLLGPVLAGAASCAASPASGPPLYGWADSWERDRCIREGNWWRPNDRLDGTGRCERVSQER